MDDTLSATGAGDDDPVAPAIEVLTSLARRTRVRGAGTPEETTEPVDFAEIAAHALTAVAANLGSVDTLVAGRPGSWEADLVRRLVEGTAGDNGGLLLWRTEPVRLEFDAEDVFFDFGISDLYEQDREQAVQRMDDELTDADTADERLDAVERLWEQDLAKYAEAYQATALRYLTERGATCGVEVVALPFPHPQRVRWDSLAEQIDEYARRHTPLPMTGAAPDWSEGTPGDALRRAGLTYTARVEAASR